MNRRSKVHKILDANSLKKNKKQPTKLVLSVFKLVTITSIAAPKIKRKGQRCSRTVEEEK